MKIRIGNGFDVHALVDNRELIIGGVTIPYSKGLAGHSDADVLLHAISDACLGAAALGDIGKHFPDTDSAYQGADSRELLRHVNQLLTACNFRVINIDSTIVAQAPKMGPYIEQMRNIIAQDLKLEVGDVNVKATTTEKLGFEGRGEGISVYASVLIQIL